MSKENNPSDSPLDEMLAGLMADGVLQSKGNFTLNHERAREQMGAARFSEPDRYVLGLVQAAVMHGAQNIGFEIDTDDMVMTFDGPPFSDEELQRVFSELKLDPSDPESALRWELAMAVAAAESLKPRFIAIVSGDGEKGSAVLIQPDKPYQFHALESPFEGTRIHVKSRLQAGQLVDSLKNLDHSLPQEELLRERCRYASVAIKLEGRRISHPMTLEDAIGETPLEGSNLRGVAGYIIDRIDPAEVRLLRHGVWLDTSTDDLTAAGFVAVVESPGLQMDLSQAAAVRNKTHEAMVAAARTAQPEALLDLCRQAAQRREDEDEHRAWYRTVVKSAVEAMEQLPRGEDADDLSKALARVPIFRMLPGDAKEKNRWSIAQLDDWLAQDKPLGYVPPLSADPFGGDARRIQLVVDWCNANGGRALKLATHDDKHLVRALFGESVRALTAAPEREVPQDHQKRPPRSRTRGKSRQASSKKKGQHAAGSAGKSKPAFDPKPVNWGSADPDAPEHDVNFQSTLYSLAFALATLAVIGFAFLFFFTDAC